MTVHRDLKSEKIWANRLPAKLVNYFLWVIKATSINHKQKNLFYEDDACTITKTFKRLRKNTTALLHFVRRCTVKLCVRVHVFVSHTLLANWIVYTLPKLRPCGIVCIWKVHFSSCLVLFKFSCAACARLANCSDFGSLELILPRCTLTISWRGKKTKADSAVCGRIAWAWWTDYQAMSRTNLHELERRG